MKQQHLFDADESAYLRAEIARLNSHWSQSERVFASENMKLRKRIEELERDKVKLFSMCQYWMCEAFRRGTA